MLTASRRHRSRPRRLRWQRRALTKGFCGPRSMGWEVDHYEEVIQEVCWRGAEALLECPCLMREE